MSSLENEDEEKVEENPENIKNEPNSILKKSFRRSVKRIEKMYKSYR